MKILNSQSSEVSSKISSSKAAVTYVSLKLFPESRKLCPQVSFVHACFTCDLTYSTDEPPPPSICKQRRFTKAVTTDATTPAPGRAEQAEQEVEQAKQAEKIE